MTSEERKRARYQRRKARREQKHLDFLYSLPTYEEIFTFENLWEAFWKCREEVSWKPSIQIFQQNLSFEIVSLIQELQSPTGFQSDGFIEFNICERGKMRHIRSVNIRERVVQRCFCDNYIVPLLSHNLIYDNGASLKNKGLVFSIKRLEKQLKDFYKTYNTNEGYILLYDFSNFFGNIDHTLLYERIDPLLLDERCKKLFHHLVDAFGEVGLGLGSQVSQVSAIAFPNDLDHLFKDQLHCKWYGRYMDDGYVIFRTKDELNHYVQNLFECCEKLKITLNPKKIRVCKINRSFKFLKKRFFLADDGQVCIRLNRENIYKHRRRMVKLKGLEERDKLKHENVCLAHKSWMGQVKKYHSKQAVHSVDLQIRRILNHD
jgi:hypothetical protein